MWSWPFLFEEMTTNENFLAFIKKKMVYANKYSPKYEQKQARKTQNLIGIHTIISHWGGIHCKHNLLHTRWEKRAGGTFFWSIQYFTVLQAVQAVCLFCRMPIWDPNPRSRTIYATSCGNSRFQKTFWIFQNEASIQCFIHHHHWLVPSVVSAFYINLSLFKSASLSFIHSTSTATSQDCKIKPIMVILFYLSVHFDRLKQV